MEGKLTCYLDFSTKKEEDIRHGTHVPYKQAHGA